MVLVSDSPAFLEFSLRYLTRNLRPLWVEQRTACRRHRCLDDFLLGALHERARVFRLYVAADLLRLHKLLLFVLQFLPRLV